MLKAKGIVKVEKGKSRIVVDLSLDIVRYYNWFISKEYWIRMQTPMHGAHITVANTKFHENIDWDAAQKYHNTQIEFEYDPNMVRGGYTKGFIMFYLRVFSKAIENMKKEMGIVEGQNYKGLHLTLANSKNGGILLDWPKMIEIKYGK